MDRGAAFGGRAPWLPPPTPAANTALPLQAKPGQLIRLPGQTRVAPEEYREFLALGHGGIFDLDLDRLDPASAVWRQGDAVVGDFFNYDLDEAGWREYCARVKDYREQCALLPIGMAAGHIRHGAPPPQGYGGMPAGLPAPPNGMGAPRAPMPMPGAFPGGRARPPMPMPMPPRAPMPAPMQRGAPGPPGPGSRPGPPGPGPRAAPGPTGPAVPKAPAMSFDFGKKFSKRGSGGGGSGGPGGAPGEGGGATVASAGTLAGGGGVTTPTTVARVAAGGDTAAGS